MRITMLKNKGEVQRYSKLVKAQKYAMLRLQALRYVRENFPQRYAGGMSLPNPMDTPDPMKVPGMSGGAPQQPKQPQHQVGEVMWANGHQYVLNRNHRWERVDKAQPQPRQPAAPQPEVDPRRPQQVQPEESQLADRLRQLPMLKGARIDADENGVVVTARNGKQVRVRTEQPNELQSLAEQNPQEAGASAALGGFGQIAGAYRNGELILRADANAGEMSHEMVHAFQDMGVISPKEVAQLGGAENIAYEYQNWVEQGRNETGHGIFERMWDFVKSLFGDREAQLRQLMRKLDTGKAVSKREQNRPFHMDPTDPWSGVRPDGTMNAPSIQFATREWQSWADRLMADETMLEHYGEEGLKNLVRGMEATARIFGDFSMLPEEQGGSPIRKNSDPLFGFTADSSTSCPEQDQYVAQVNALQHHFGRLFSKEERFYVKCLMQSYGHAPSCWYCYGQSARDKAADTFNKAQKIFGKATEGFRSGELTKLYAQAEKAAKPFQKDLAPLIKKQEKLEAALDHERSIEPEQSSAKGMKPLLNKRAKLRAALDAELAKGKLSDKSAVKKLKDALKQNKSQMTATHKGFISQMDKQLKEVEKTAKPIHNAIYKSIPRDVKKQMEDLWGREANDELKSGYEQAWAWWNPNKSKIATIPAYMQKYANDPEAAKLWQNLPRVHDLAMGYENPQTVMEQETVTALRAVMSVSQINIPKGWSSYDKQIQNMDQFHIDSFNKSDGLRFNSQTDFRPWHVVEMSQMLTHLGQKGGMGHLYTRQPEAVEIFGNTGLKFNLSVGYARDLNGNVMRDEKGPVYDMIGMSREDAQRLRSQYSENVGTMMVALDDEQFSTALDDDGIDMIIPYHAGSVPKAVDKFKGAKNYEDWQHEHWDGFDQSQKKKFEVAPGKYKEEAYKTVNLPDGRQVDIRYKQPITREHHNNDRETYLSICDQLGITPRFEGVIITHGPHKGKPATEHPNYMKLVRDVAAHKTPQQAVDPRKINWDAAEKLEQAYVKKGGHKADMTPNSNLQEMLKQDIEMGKLEWMKENKGVPSPTVRSKEDLATARVFAEMPSMEPPKPVDTTPFQASRVRNSVIRYLKAKHPQWYARQMAFNFDAPQIPELKSPGISAPQDPNHPRAPVGGTSVSGEQYTGGQFIPKEKVEEVAEATGKSKEEVASDIQQGQDPAASPPQQPAPEAPKSRYQDVLDQAAPYRQYGEGYDRNIAAPANRLEQAVSEGRDPKMLEYLADELQMRLDALARPKHPEKPSAPILTPEQIKDRNASHRRAAAKQQSLLNPKIDAAMEAAPAELPLDADNPREAAAAKQKAQDADYVYARVSMIGNRGEDLKGSARHKVNAWRGLAQAESDGTAAELVNRSSLEKVEPYDYTAIAVHNPIGAIAAYLAMRRFPPKPGASGKHASSDEETAKKDRQQYVESWMTLKKHLGDIAQVEDDPRQLMTRMREAVAVRINELRGKVPGAKSDHYNNTANGLVALHNSLSPYGTHSTSIMRHLGEFASWMQSTYPDVSPDELAERTQEHALQIMEGTSIDKLRGVTKKKGVGGTEFSAAEMYVGKAERQGGSQLPVRTANEAIDYMTDKMRMRGVQFGNSVTDKEREHHGIKSAEAMLDLMDVLGLEADDASIGGKLGFAIGARGHGDALAHYEPSNQVINLTRKGGVGSLAHEWGHFFDHALEDYRSDSYMSRSHQDAYMVTVKKTGYQLTVGSNVLGHYKDKNDYDVTPLPHSEVRAAYAKWNQTRSAFSSRLSKAVHKIVSEGYMSRKKAQYWTSSIEVFARSFERYVQRKLEASGRKNTYLSGVVDGSHTSEDSLWPTDAEVDAMTPAFDEIFAAYAQSDMRKKAKAREQYCRRLSRQLNAVIRYVRKPLNHQFV